MPQLISSIEAIATYKPVRSGVKRCLLQHRPIRSAIATRPIKSFIQSQPAQNSSPALPLHRRNVQSARVRGLPRSITRNVCLRLPPEYRVVSRLDRSKRTQSFWQDRWREERHRRSKEERSHKTTQGLFSWLITLCVPGPALAQWYRDYKQQQRQLAQAKSWCEHQRDWVQHYKLHRSPTEGL